MATKIVAQLKENGEVTRGWLGVNIQDLKGELAEYYGAKGGEGVLVTEVVPGNPAEKAGIKAKDIITAVNGEKVKSSRELTAKAATLPVGETTKITVVRDGQEKTLDVKVAKRPADGRRCRQAPGGKRGRVRPAGDRPDPGDGPAAENQPRDRRGRGRRAARTARRPRPACSRAT
ncbi:MAG: S1C family serine protease [Desulfobacterales bacterium]|nr:S1C family serine protease [Desulfobacterales bacterium]